ncbi:hypothetical protein [Shewanella aestuarii]|uniref:Uncharacterized protein n=1 Tax=Shewanella aestuarii TaxID=1028752 RepID=A0A6G9QS34_9GAMM|nr:hypothetical protein [Shewanella aestuarii]QIR16591.1 hypothetical protein HBH39_19135 [Shewanella aestuarii]
MMLNTPNLDKDALIQDEKNIHLTMLRLHRDAIGFMLDAVERFDPAILALFASKFCENGMNTRDWQNSLFRIDFSDNVIASDDIYESKEELFTKDEIVQLAERGVQITDERELSVMFLFWLQRHCDFPTLPRGVKFGFLNNDVLFHGMDVVFCDNKNAAHFNFCMCVAGDNVRLSIETEDYVITCLESYSFFDGLTELVQSRLPNFCDNPLYQLHNSSLEEIGSGLVCSVLPSIWDTEFDNSFLAALDSHKPSLSRSLERLFTAHGKTHPNEIPSTIDDIDFIEFMGCVLNKGFPSFLHKFGAENGDSVTCILDKAWALRKSVAVEDRNRFLLDAQFIIFNNALLSEVFFDKKGNIQRDQSEFFELIEHPLFKAHYADNLTHLPIDLQTPVSIAIEHYNSLQLSNNIDKLINDAEMISHPLVDHENDCNKLPSNSL